MRAGRRWLTAKASYAARTVAPFVPPSAVNLAEWWMTRTGPTWPVLSRIIARNMESAGVYDRRRYREHFAQLALHLSNAMRIFRLARQNGAVGSLARSQIDVDASIAHLHEALKQGRGAIVAPPHVCNYLMTLTRLNQEVPIKVYLRWSDDARKRGMKRDWCEASGLDVILERADAADPAARAAACVEALRGGAVLVMTPDIAQKSDKGVAVRLLGREVYLPSGPASIAMLAEAPLVPVFGRLNGGKHTILAHPPIEVERLDRADGGRHAALQNAMQTWADHFEAFLISCPQAWFLWGDSRWTRVFQGDARYAAAIGSPTGDREQTQEGGSRIS